MFSHPAFARTRREECVQKLPQHFLVSSVISQHRGVSGGSESAVSSRCHFWRAGQWTLIGS